jgi:hypothetical protein
MLASYSSVESRFIESLRFFFRRRSVAGHKLAQDERASLWKLGDARLWHSTCPEMSSSLVAFGKDMADTIHMMLFPSRRSACMLLCVLLQLPFFAYGQDSRKSDALQFFRFWGEPVPSTTVHTVLQRQALWDDSGRDQLNPSGLQLRFEKIDEQSTPGGHSATRYRVFAAGAPENKVFSLEYWPVGKDIAGDDSDLYVNTQGLLMIHRPKAEQEMSFKAGADELEITAETDTAEPIRYVLTSKDGELKIFRTLVPHPVVAVDQGCSLEVRIAEPHGAAVLVIANGFPEKAKIPLVLQSEGVKTSEMLVTDSDGHGVMAGLPSVQGKAQGMLKAAAEGPNCLPSVVLPWTADPTLAPEKTKKH